MRLAIPLTVCALTEIEHVTSDIVDVPDYQCAPDAFNIQFWHFNVVVFNFKPFDGRFIRLSAIPVNVKLIQLMSSLV